MLFILLRAKRPPRCGPGWDSDPDEMYQGYVAIEGPEAAQIGSEWKRSLDGAPVTHRDDVLAVTVKAGCPGVVSRLPSARLQFRCVAEGRRNVIGVLISRGYNMICYTGAEEKELYFSKAPSLESGVLAHAGVAPGMGLSIAQQGDAPVVALTGEEGEPVAGIPLHLYQAPALPPILPAGFALGQASPSPPSPAASCAGDDGLS